MSWLIDVTLIPNQASTLFPWHQRYSIGTLAIGSGQRNWFESGWNLCCCEGFFNQVEYTSCRLETAKSMNTGCLNSCSTNASVRSAISACWGSMLSCDGKLVILSDASSSCVPIEDHGSACKNAPIGCWSRSEPGNPSLVRCGRQHFVHGNSNKRHIPCLVIDGKLRKLHSSWTFSPHINHSINEKLVIGACCTMKMTRQQQLHY